MMIRTLSFLAILILLTNAINAQRVIRKGMNPMQTKSANKKIPDFSLKELQGRWQEYERIDRNNNPIGFTDSIQLYFTDSNKVQTRTSINTTMTLDGDADIDGDNNLYVASDVYTIRSMAKNILVLDDNSKYIHHLKKLDLFWYEMLGKIKVKQESHNEPVNVVLDSLLAKWSVYKRIAKPGAVNNDMLLVKYLNVTKKTSDSTATGDITFYQGQSAQQSTCSIILSGSDLKITAGQNVWNLSVYQAGLKDLIFGNTALLYFAKSEK